jgi:hypothetical protein
MHWGSLDNFLAMGGYGFYVWISFGLTLACLLFELYGLQKRHVNSQGDI